MLADPAIFSEVPSRPQHTVVGWALLLSALLHLMLVAFIDPLSHWRAVRPHSAAPLPALEVQLRAAQPVAEIPVAATEPPAAAARQPRANIPPEERTPVSPQAVEPRLNLLLPELPGQEQTTGRGLTDNGAVVMRPELLGLLQAGERHTGYQPDQARGESGEFQGGSWVEMVRDGNRCFRVVRADPLDSTSHDIWYRIACG